MEGPISFWGYKEQESNLILPEHDDENFLKIYFFGYNPVEKQVGKCLQGTMLFVYSLS